MDRVDRFFEILLGKNKNRKAKKPPMPRGLGGYELEHVGYFGKVKVWYANPIERNKYGPRYVRA